MADKVGEARADIYLLEVMRKASISEATAQKIAGAINFINNRQYDTHQFNFNGLYKLGVGVVGADGYLPVLFDMEITGISMVNRLSGTSSYTEIDLQWFSGSNSNEGSIFSTLPRISNEASDNCYLIWDEINDVGVSNPAGTTLPVLTKTEFNAGDAIFCKINSAMPDAEDCALYVHFRPR